MLSYIEDSSLTRYTKTYFNIYLALVWRGSTDAILGPSYMCRFLNARLTRHNISMLFYLHGPQLHTRKHTTTPQTCPTVLIEWASWLKSLSSMHWCIWNQFGNNAWLPMYSQPIEGRIFLWISEHASTHQSSGEQIYSVYSTANIFINTIDTKDSIQN